jgi:hypothetical protein
MKSPKIIFLLSIIVLLFWGIGNSVNVYRVAVVGAIFEILWLPMIGLTLVLPIVSFIFWFKEKFAVRSLNFYSLLITSAMILVAIFVPR